MSNLIRLKATFDMQTHRTFDIQANASLEKLAATIIRYYNFDFDHAFGFYDNLDNPYDSQTCYTLFADMDDIDDDFVTNGGSVRKTKVAQVFQTGTQMIFLFDYGDDWMFHLTCLDDNVARVKGKRYPQLVAQEGRAPEQYPDYEEIAEEEFAE